MWKPDWQKSSLPSPSRGRRERPIEGWRRRLWEGVGPRSWWIWSFALLCAAGYHFASQRQQNLILELSQRRTTLLEQTERAIEREQALLAQISSQAEPAWIEQVLMRGLGVVPEGQTKVYFAKEKL